MDVRRKTKMKITTALCDNETVVAEI